LALEWADIDLDRRQIIVRHSDWNGELTAPKNGRIRYVGMPDRLATALRRHGHTFFSHLAMQGAPMRGVQELVGHQSLAMTQRYSHLTPTSLESTIRLLDNRPIRRAVGDNLETPKGRDS
jgi:integrase